MSISALPRTAYRLRLSAWRWIAATLVACAGGALAQPLPLVNITGEADSSMAAGAGQPATFDDLREGTGFIVAANGVVSYGEYRDLFVDPMKWSRSSSQAVAWAQPGHVGVQVGAEVVLGAVGPNFNYAYGRARSQFVDFLTLTPADPALLGTSGVLRHRLDVAGNGGLLDSSTTAAVSAGWCVHPPDGIAVCGQWYSTNLGVGVGAQDGVMPPWSAEFDLAFTWGASFGVGFGLSAHAEIVDLSNGRAQADFSLLHSAAWGGVISVTDVAGNTIAPGAYQLLSASGADYSGPIAAAVPEVPTLLMLSSGVLLLACRRRARPGP